MMNDRVNRLFVYGTLMPGGPNESVLARTVGEPGAWLAASVIGQRHQQGWGAEMGYPGITLEDNGEEIAGYVFEAANLSDHWEALDVFEGNGYERVLTEVKLPDMQSIAAYVYVVIAG